MLDPVIGLYPDDPKVEYFDYDPRSPDVARRVADLITQQLPSVTVEHIGSTAIAGCAGKGIIDLMLLYPSGQLGIVKEGLEALGFQPQKSGHPFPEERPMRVGTLEYREKVYRVHVHVIAADSPEAENFRDFRDQLRVHPELMAAYVAWKRRIVESGVSEPIEYTQRKRSFIEAILAHQMPQVS